MHYQLYILRAGDSHYKVGVSSDVLKRIKSIQTSNQNKIELVLVRQVHNPRMMESEIHRWLKDHRANGGTEWFALEPTHAIDLVIKISSLEPETEIPNYLELRNILSRQLRLEERVEYLSKRLTPQSSNQPTSQLLYTIETKKTGSLIEEAKALLLSSGKASTSMLQRKLRIGYSHAARLMDELEDAGVVSPLNGNNPRQLLSPKQPE